MNYRGVKLQRNNSFTRSNSNFYTFEICDLPSKMGVYNFFNDLLAVLKCVRVQLSDACGQATPADTSRDKFSEASPSSRV